jgi:hypothetical protein
MSILEQLQEYKLKQMLEKFWEEFDKELIKKYTQNDRNEKDPGFDKG